MMTTNELAIFPSRSCKASMDCIEASEVMKCNPSLIDRPTDVALLCLQDCTKEEVEYLQFVIREVLQAGHNKTTRKILKFITCRCSLWDFIQALCQTGQLRVAEDLYKRVHHNKRQITVPKHESNSARRKNVHRYFLNLKRIVHNGILSNPNDWLKKQGLKIMKERGSACSLEEYQYLTDKYASHLAVMIDNSKNFDANVADEPIYVELKSLSSDSSDSQLVDILYYTRMANGLAIAKRFAEAEGMARAALCSANTHQSCLETVYMIYLVAYFKLWQFEDNPSREILEDIKFFGRMGLWALSEETEEVRHLLERMFILKTAFPLLAIDNKLNIVPNFAPTMEDVENAADLLDKINLNRIETKREIFFYVAKARVYQLQGLTHDAYLASKRAQQLSESSNVCREHELGNIRKIVESLEKLSEETAVKTVDSIELASSPTLVDDSMIEHTGHLQTSSPVEYFDSDAPGHPQTSSPVEYFDSDAPGHPQTSSPVEHRDNDAPGHPQTSSPVEHRDNDSPGHPQTTTPVEYFDNDAPGHPQTTTPVEYFDNDAPGHPQKSTAVEHRDNNVPTLQDNGHINDLAAFSSLPWSILE